MENFLSKIKGLNSYNEADSKNFFGRDVQIESSLEILKKNKILTVNGSQSSGKTSFVKAGIFNRINNKFQGESGNNWSICSFRPGLSPIENLCTALSSDKLLYLNSKPNSSDFDDYLETFKIKESFGLLDIFKKSEIFGKKNVLIHIDHFEDIFRYPKFYDRDKHLDDELFIETINKTIKNNSCSIYFIITIQSNFLTKLNSYGTFSELLSLSQFNLPNLDFNSFFYNIKNDLKFSISPNLIDSLKNQLSEKPSLLSNFQFLLKHYQINEGNEIKELNENHFNLKNGLSNIVGEKINSYLNNQPEENKVVYEKIFRSLINSDTESSKIYYQKFSYIKEYSGLSSKNLTKMILNLNENFGFLFDTIEKNISPVKSKYNFEFSNDSLIVLKNSETFNWKSFKDWERDELMKYEYVGELSQFNAESKKLNTIELKKALNFINNPLINDNWSNKYELDFSAIKAYIFSQKEKFDFEVKDKLHKEHYERKKIRNRRILYGILASLGLYFISDLYIERRDLKKDNEEFKDLKVNYNKTEKKYDSLTKSMESLNNILLKEQDELTASINTIQIKEEKIQEIQKKIVSDRTKIDSQRIEIVRNKNEIISANKEIEISKNFIELTTREITLNNRIKFNVQEILLLRDDEKNKKIQYAKQSINFYKEFLNIVKTKDCLINLYPSELEAQKTLTVSTTNSDRNNLRQLAFLTLNKLNNVQFITQTPELNLLSDVNKGLNNSINRVEVTVDGRIIAAGKPNKIFFSIEKTKEIRNLKFNSISIHDEVTSIAAVNSEVLFTGLSNGELWYLSLVDNNKVKIYPKKGNSITSPINEIKLVDNTIFFAHKNKILNYNPQSKILDEINLKQIGNENIVDFTYDNDSRIYIVSDSGKIFVYNLNNNYHSLIFNSINNINFSNNDKVSKVVFFENKFMFGTEDGWIYLFDMISNSKPKFNRRFLAHKSEISSIYYDKNDNKLMSSAVDGSFCIVSLSEKDKISQSRIDLNFGIENKINDLLSYNDDFNKYLIIGDNNGSLSFLDLDLKDVFNLIQKKIEDELSKN